MKLRIFAMVMTVAAAAEAATFTVTNVNDSGTGSLRWAIEQANATPGHDFIVARSTGTIALKTPLPPITEAVDIGDYASTPIVIDGSNAGPVDGLVIAAGPSYVSAPWTVKNLAGSGIVIRASTALYWVTSSGNQDGVRVDRGVAEILGGHFTNNTRYGIWITHGANGNAVGKPEFICGFECVPTPGPNDVDGNGSTGILVEGDDNLVDTARVGTGAPNRGDGIVINGAHNAVINSTLANNGGFGAYLVQPARFQRNSGDCNAGDFVGGSTIDPPRVTFARADPTATTITGELRAKPNTNYTLDINDGKRPCPVTSMTPLGSLSVTTDSAGFASWRTVVGSLKPASALTVLATRYDAEETSRRSERFDTLVSNDTRVDLGVRTSGPTVAVVGQILEFETVVTNYGPSAIDYVNLSIPRPPNTQFVSAETTSGGCWLSGLQFCGLNPLAAGEQAIVHHRLRVRAVGGNLHYTASVRSAYTQTLVFDPNSSNDTASIDVPISTSPRSRPVQH